MRALAASPIARIIVIVAIVAGLAWVVYKTVTAGGDIPAPQNQLGTVLSGGQAGGKRLDGKSWSLDYDSLTMSPDGMTADIQNVHDGVIYRDGKPYMHVRAEHITANRVTNDFTVRGKVEFTQIGGADRHLTTTGATFAGFKQQLTLAKPTVIRDGPTTITVANAVIDFRSGNVTTGRIVGTM